MAIGYNPVEVGQAYLAGTLNATGGLEDVAAAMGLSHGAVGLIILNVYAAMIFAAKAVIVVWVQIWLRWTLPRIRIDQVLHTCVKVLLPLGLVTLVGAGVWVWLVDGRDAASLLTRNDLSLQTATQWVLTVIGLTVAGAMLFVMSSGWWGVLRRSRNQPPKSLFADVMPVGRDVTFARGDEAT
jgi:hypothetical protein